MVDKDYARHPYGKIAAEGQTSVPENLVTGLSLCLDSRLAFPAIIMVWKIISQVTDEREPSLT
jgi:Na+/H+-translocating membrane pyrophosphatase